MAQTPMQILPAMAGDGPTTASVDSTEIGTWAAQGWFTADALVGGSLKRSAHEMFGTAAKQAFAATGTPLIDG